jgi:predicted Zn-dependent peptidase
MQLAHDPLVFDQRTLPNGVQLFHREHPVDFTHISVRFPIGSGHNVTPILPGSFHFLEHALFLGSKLHPRPQQYQQLVEQAGGSLDGSIGPDETEYSLSLPTVALPGLLPGFFSMLFEPVFVDSELARERTVVATERKRAERWFPGSNEVGHHMETKRLRTSQLELRTRLGFDEDLEQMDVAYLAQLHAHYLVPGIQVVSVGGMQPQQLWDALEGLVLNRELPPKELITPHWIDRSFQELAFRDVSRPAYLLEGLSPVTLDLIQLRAFNTALSYLFSNGTGAIYKWLRDELGRVYELNHGSSYIDHTHLHWYVRVPMSEVEHLHQLRAELPGKIAEALADEAAIAAQLERQLNSMPYWYQTAGSIAGEAVGRLEFWGKLFPLQQTVDAMLQVSQPGYLAATWKYLVLERPDELGDVIILPKPDSVQ